MKNGDVRSWSVLRALHLLVGIGAFYVFGRSGIYMDQELDHLVGMADAPRALYRSAHMYILFAALINLSLGFYLVRSRSLLGRLAQYIGSGFLFAAVLYFVRGFYVETPLGIIERPMVRNGIYFTVNGIIFHGVGALILSWLPAWMWTHVPSSMRDRIAKMMPRRGRTA